MTKTANYDLNQWAAADRVQRTDFNSDNEKIDAALKSLSDSVGTKADASAITALTAALNQKASAADLSTLSAAQLKLKTGTYTGSGTYGSSNPTSLTFDFVPKLVIVISPSLSFFIWNGGSLISGLSCPNFHSFEGKTLRWWQTSSSDQMNSSGSVYSYFAIG